MTRIGTIFATAALVVGFASSAAWADGSTHYYGSSKNNYHGSNSSYGPSHNNYNGKPDFTGSPSEYHSHSGNNYNGSIEQFVQTAVPY